VESIIYLIFACIEQCGGVAGGAGFGLAMIPLAITTIPGIWITSWFIDLLSIQPGNNSEIFLLVLTGIVQWFVIGAIIGCIYGKFKK
jgi:hypothetical protein